MIQGIEAAPSEGISSFVILIPVLVALVPWVGAYFVKRWRPPQETREVELKRLSDERAQARLELQEDKADLRARVDDLEERMKEYEVENRRLRIVEERQGHRIGVLERALRDANIPIPAYN